MAQDDFDDEDVDDDDGFDDDESVLEKARATRVGKCFKCGLKSLDFTREIKTCQHCGGRMRDVTLDEATNHDPPEIIQQRERLQQQKAANAKARKESIEKGMSKVGEIIGLVLLLYRSHFLNQVGSLKVRNAPNGLLT